MTLRVGDEGKVFANVCFYKHGCSEHTCSYYAPLPMHVSAPWDSMLDVELRGPKRLCILSFKTLLSSHTNVSACKHTCRDGHMEENLGS